MVLIVFAILLLSTAGLIYYTVDRKNKRKEKEKNFFNSFALINGLLTFVLAVSLFS